MKDGAGAAPDTATPPDTAICTPSTLGDYELIMREVGKDRLAEIINSDNEGLFNYIVAIAARALFQIDSAHTMIRDPAEINQAIMCQLKSIRAFIARALARMSPPIGQDRPDWSTLLPQIASIKTENLFQLFGYAQQDVRNGSMSINDFMNFAKEFLKRDDLNGGRYIGIASKYIRALINLGQLDEAQREINIFEASCHTRYIMLPGASIIIGGLKGFLGKMKDRRGTKNAESTTPTTITAGQSLASTNPTPATSADLKESPPQSLETSPIREAINEFKSWLEELEQLAGSWDDHKGKKVVPDSQRAALIAQLAIKLTRKDEILQEFSRHEGFSQQLKALNTQIGNGEFTIGLLRILKMVLKTYLRQS